MSTYQLKYMVCRELVGAPAPESETGEPCVCLVVGVRHTVSGTYSIYVAGSDDYAWARIAHTDSLAPASLTVRRWLTLPLPHRDRDVDDSMFEGMAKYETDFAMEQGLKKFVLREINDAAPKDGGWNQIYDGDALPNYMIKRAEQLRDLPKSKPKRRFSDDDSSFASRFEERKETVSALAMPMPKDLPRVEWALTEKNAQRFVSDSLSGGKFWDIWYQSFSPTVEHSPRDEAYHVLVRFGQVGRAGQVREVARGDQFGCQTVIRERIHGKLERGYVASSREVSA